MTDMERVCPETDVLGAWVEGSLPLTERPRVKAHLASCDDCRRTVALASTLEAVEAEVAVDDLFAQRLAAAARRRPRWPWAVAAAGLLAAGAALLAGRSGRAPEPPTVVLPTPPATEAVAKVEPPVVAPAPPPPAVPRPTPPAPPAVVEDQGQPLVAVPVPPPVVPPKVEAPKPPAVEPTVPVPVPAPSPVVARPATETDLSLVFMPVFAVDPAGDLWLRREAAEPAKAGAFERVAFRDVFAARADAAAFTLEGRAAVILEKGAEAAVSWYRAEESFRLDLARGVVYVDTEGRTQKWQFAAGMSRASLSDLAGKVAVEMRAEGIGIVLLEGKAVLDGAGRKHDLGPGREVILSPDGAAELRKVVPTADRLARLAKARPKTSTVFAATFDERKDVVLPFPYTVLMGRVVPTSAGAYLEATAVTGRSAGERGPLTAALKPDRMIEAADGMVIRFRYRTTLSAFTVKLVEPQADGRDREYAALVPVRGKAATWTEVELPLGTLVDEGVPVVPSTRIREVRLVAADPAGKSPILQVDSLHFLRRANR
jgi:hypothetical protein